jgi:hypothetical protein
MTSGTARPELFTKLQKLRLTMTAGVNDRCKGGTNWGLESCMSASISNSSSRNSQKYYRLEESSS